MSEIKLLSVVMPYSSSFTNKNIKALSKHSKSIEYILIKDKNTGLHKETPPNYNMIKSITLTHEKNYIIDTSALASIVNYANSKNILFIDDASEINKEHFHFFLEAASTLREGYLYGVSLINRDSHWYPSQKEEISANLSGGIIFTKDCIRDYISLLSGCNSIYDSIFIDHKISTENRKTLIDYVIILCNSVHMSTAFEYPTEILLTELDKIFHIFQKDPTFPHYLWKQIQAPLWTSLTQSQDWGRRLENFLKIRSSFRRYFRNHITSINFMGQEISTQTFLNTDPAFLLQQLNIFCNKI